MYKNQRQDTEWCRSTSNSEDVVRTLTGRLSNLTLPTEQQARPGRPGDRMRYGPGLARRLFADSEKSGSEDGRLFDPGDHSADELDGTLKEFLKTSAPSKMQRSDGIGWIRVRSRSFKGEGLGNVENLETARKEWEESQTSENTNFEDIKAIALSNQCLSGIWLLFVGHDVDAAWEKIARATVEDELGTHAKVTPCQDVGEGKDLHGQEHVISVYTADFSDKTDVLRVERALRGLGFRERINFKPRVYSSLGIYAGNEWGLIPSIFTSDWDAETQAGKIRDNTKHPGTYTINY